MKLLMITRKVDQQDASPAGFTYNWVKKIGQRLEKLYVITWQKSSQGDLPENIEIISLPKNKLLKIFIWPFKLLKFLARVDGVFCHQNPEYTILSAPWAIIFRKRIISWYTHKAVNCRRRLMELLADKILTASDKSFRQPLFAKKVEITGHGIDTDYFKKWPIRGKDEGKFKIVSIGRISPVKDYETLIGAIEILVKERKIKDLAVEIIGEPVLESDWNYFLNFKESIKEKSLKNYIKTYEHGIAHSQILESYSYSDLMINLSQTGSIDKAVLEAMACQTLVLTSNEAFIDVLRDERLLFKPRDSRDLADKIIGLMNLPDEEKQNIGQRLRKEVVENHNLDKLVEKILSFYEK